LSVASIVPKRVLLSASQMYEKAECRRSRKLPP
jgi:hypothetical protein